MQIKIKKDKNQYFAELIGKLWLHAVGGTPDEAVEYLLDMIKIDNEIKQQRYENKFLVEFKKPLFNFDFRSITINI